MYSKEEFIANLQREVNDSHLVCIRDIVSKFSLRIVNSELTPQNVMSMILEAYANGVDDVTKLIENAQAKMNEYKALSELLNNKNEEDSHD